MIDPAEATVDRTGAILLPGCDLLSGLRNGTWLDEQEFPPLRYAVPGLIPEGMTVLVGPPKAGKSWAVLDMALAVAAGGRALGRLAVGRARQVFYLALEDGDRRLQERCRALLAGDGIPGRFQYLTRLSAGSVLDTIRVWLELQAGEAGQLVILDTLGKVMPPALAGESAYARDYRVGSALKRLADDFPGTSLVVVHHDRKAGSEDFVDSVSGTHGIAGSADTIAVLARPRGRDAALFKITGRDVPEGEYALTLTDGRWTLDGDDLDAAAVAAQLRQQTEALGDRSADIMAFVSQRPEGVRPSEVEQVFGPDSRRYLARLAESGRLLRPKRGLYTPVPTVSTSQTDQTTRGVLSLVGDELGQRDGWESHTGEDEPA
ncbi:MAG TPA: AAA family ATPase [Amycolatopsis sp.]|uniref:AAA family ATPase n=1 Tax=Amycolatopsis sp. TaxID=37632 RepID=UPI002B49CFB7|nr:AAA family ATPase [Amycolatopsis sp.]HKS47371.1 AAA family ATPase [Amycolatopsis sp.]